jgi:hypothetical protein
VPKKVLSEMTIHYVNHMDQVLEVILAPEAATDKPKPTRRAPAKKPVEAPKAAKRTGTGRKPPAAPPATGAKGE